MAAKTTVALSGRHGSAPDPAFEVERRGAFMFYIMCNGWARLVYAGPYLTKRRADRVAFLLNDAFGFGYRTCLEDFGSN